MAGAVSCALALVGIITLTSVASKTSAVTISAHLTEKKSFTEARVKKVKLVYSLSATSTSFAYRLAFKKGPEWQTVTSVKKTGIFRGTHKIKLRGLFAGKPVKVGDYRLQLIADGGNRLLGFTVKGSKPVNTVLPAISGATRQGQALTASKGSWNYSPTSYNYQWRRCDSDGASCSDISGASANSYTLSVKDIAGSTARVVVTASNSYGSAKTASAPMAVGATVRETSAGEDHTCALSSVGTVKCWGSNSGGQLGNGTHRVSTTPVQVKGVGGTGTLSNVTQISAGNHYTCALLSNHTVECWGENGDGQLGNGTHHYSTTPVRVERVSGTGTLSNVTEISAGAGHTCALLSDGTVECWGANWIGQLGNGARLRLATTDSSIPVRVKGVGGTGALSNVAEISAGAVTTCALLTDRTVKCWGYNSQGELGNGTTISSSTPVPVKGNAGTSAISDATQISAGGNHTCTLLTDRTVKCWGTSGAGELGNGVDLDWEAKNYRSTPVQVKGVGGTGTLSNVTQISTGDDYTCALQSDHTVECWGDNYDGDLGDGTVNYSSTPAHVKGVGGTGALSNVTQIGAGYEHTCALLADHTVECWGSNYGGELGNGKRGFSAKTPVSVIGIP